MEELHLSLNEHGAVQEHSQKFQHITNLHFVNNGITEWNCIQNVAKAFPCLENLIVSENNFEYIKDDNLESIFPKLATLSISQTKVNNWDSIDLLRKFPALNDIRLVKIPLLEKHSEDERRKLLIARLPNAKKLNGSVINETEREEAERMFIRYHMDHESLPERYHELVEIHGQLQPLVDIDLSRRDLADLIIHFEDINPFIMKVDLDQTVKDFKKLLGDRLGQSCARLRIFYRDNDEEVYGERNDEELRKPYKQLYTYRMKDGDEILVVMRPKEYANLTIHFEDTKPFIFKADLDETDEDFTKLLADRLGQDCRNLKVFFRMYGKRADVFIGKADKQLFEHRMRDGDEIYCKRVRRTAR